MEMNPEQPISKAGEMVQEVKDNLGKLNLVQDIFKIDDMACTLVTFASQD